MNSCDQDFKKNDNDVKGIKVGNSVYLISQYTDDTALILYGSEKSLKVDLDELHLFYRASRLKSNLSKLQIIRFEGKRYTTEQPCENMNLKWTTSFKLIGIIFDVYLTNIPKLNSGIKKLVKIEILSTTGENCILH